MLCGDLGAEEGSWTVFGARLRPRSCILCRGGDVWVSLRGRAVPPLMHPLPGRGTFGLLSVFPFFSQKNPAMCSLLCSPFHPEKTDFREGACWVEGSRLRDWAPRLLRCPANTAANSQPLRPWPRKPSLWDNRPHSSWDSMNPADSFLKFAVSNTRPPRHLRKRPR